MQKAVNLCNKYHFFIPGVISWATGVLLKRILACAYILTCSVSPIAVSNFWVLHETLWSPLNWFVFMQNGRHKSSPVLHICKSSFDPTLCRQLVFPSIYVYDPLSKSRWLLPLVWVYFWVLCYIPLVYVSVFVFLLLPFCLYSVACGIVFRWGIVSPVLFILCRWLWLFGPIFYDFTWIFLGLRNIVESFEGKLNWIYRLLW